MDHRDRLIWIREAQKKSAEVRKKSALEQMRACEAATFPNMAEDARSEYMNSLMRQIDDTEEFVPEIAQQSTPELEAEWAKNREELAAVFGRKTS